MKVPNVRWNLVPNTWSTDREGMFQEPSPCFHDNCCFGCGKAELASVDWNFTIAPSQTVVHIVNNCPHTKLPGGLSALHLADTELWLSMQSKC